MLKDFCSFLMTIYIIGDTLPPSAHPHETSLGGGVEKTTKKKNCEGRGCQEEVARKTAN